MAEAVPQIKNKYDPFTVTLTKQYVSHALRIQVPVHCYANSFHKSMVPCIFFRIFHYDRLRSQNKY